MGRVPTVVIIIAPFFISDERTRAPALPPPLLPLPPPRPPCRSPPLNENHTTAPQGQLRFQTAPRCRGTVLMYAFVPAAPNLICAALRRRADVWPLSRPHTVMLMKQKGGRKLHFGQSFHTSQSQAMVWAVHNEVLKCNDAQYIFSPRWILSLHFNEDV